MVNMECNLVTVVKMALVHVDQVVPVQWRTVTVVQMELVPVVQDAIVQDQQCKANANVDLMDAIVQDALVAKMEFALVTVTDINVLVEDMEWMAIVPCVEVTLV